MALIDHSVIARIYDTANIVDVVQDYVSLKRRGANYIGLCPFHNEKTGSFTVSPSKGIFKCFGCGEAGNVVSFVEKIEGCSFPDAIRKLAQRYHIEVVEEEMSEEDKKREDERQTYFRLNEFAMKWFESQLWDTDEGRSVGLSYFRGRQLRDDIIRKFHLGYAPNKNVFLQEALKQGFTQESVLKSGLCAQSSYSDDKADAKHTIFDRFRDRVIFPWFNPSGKVVAFNGRWLREKKNAGKYVNTPEVENLFEKRRELFGFTIARKEIEKAGFCYLVEGQMDVISMVQAGVENVVASSGTALTNEQVRLIKRLTQNVVLLYDGDNAGAKATLRGNEMFLRENMNIKILTLPQGDDPDSLSHKLPAEQFKEYLENNQIDFIQYHVERAKVAVEDNPYEFGQLVKSIGDLIAFIYDPISRHAYIRSASKRLEIEERDLETYVNRKITERIQEQEKEKEREKFREAYSKQREQTAADGAQPDADDIEFRRSEASAQKPVTTSAQQKMLSKRAMVERTIIGILVKYGRQTYLTYEDGSVETIAEYIIQCLDADNIVLSVDGYKKLFDDYRQHLGEPDFDAERYFASHSDPEVVEAVSELIIERYQLSKMFLKENVSENLTRQLEQPDEGAQAVLALPKIMLQLKVAIIDELLDNIKQTINSNDKQNLAEDNTLLISKQMNLLHLKQQILQAIKGM